MGEGAQLTLGTSAADRANLIGDGYIRKFSYRKLLVCGHNIEDHYGVSWSGTNIPLHCRRGFLTSFCVIVESIILQVREGTNERS